MDSNVIKHPKISVLMPVYNCEEFVEDAIVSILNQTFTDFELIIIDDASTDDTVSLIKNFTDSRIKFIEKTTNSGHTNSLIEALNNAKGEYIARMDGDDISFSERFEKQVQFLDTHPNVVLCGSAHVVLGKDKTVVRPETHEDIKIALLQKNCFTHPTVMLRNSVLKANNLNYDQNFSVTQDYDFWVRLISFGELHNLPDTLLKYRIHDNQVSVKNQTIKPKIRAKIRLRMLQYLEFEEDSQDKTLLLKIFSRQQALNANELKSFETIKQKLLSANTNSFYVKKDFESYLNDVEQLIYKDCFLNRSSYTPRIFRDYLKAKTDNIYKLNFQDCFKLFLKSMIFYKK